MMGDEDVVSLEDAIAIDDKDKKVLKVTKDTISTLMCGIFIDTIDEQIRKAASNGKRSIIIQFSTSNSDYCEKFAKLYMEEKGFKTDTSGLPNNNNKKPQISPQSFVCDACIRTCSKEPANDSQLSQNYLIRKTRLYITW